jgi:hypothetical protein
MKNVLEGMSTSMSAMPYIDRCLLLGPRDCLSIRCRSELITPFRGWAEENRQRPA